MGEMTSVQQAAAELQAKLERARNLKPAQNRAASNIFTVAVRCEICHDTGMLELMTENDQTIVLPWTQPPGLYLHDHPDARHTSLQCECVTSRLAQAKVDRLMGRLAESGVPKIYRTYSFETWDALPEHQRRGKEQARLCCELFAQGNFYVEGQERFGLVLSGDTSLGKSGLASCTLAARAERGEAVLWIDFAQFLRKIKATYQTDAEASYEQVVGVAANVEFLLIDDMGDMVRRGEVTNHTRDVLYDVISERYNELRPTLITTNLTFKQLRGQFGDRIADRIFQLYHWIDVTGANLRVGE